MSDETIFGLIEQKEKTRKKLPIYRSKYPGDMPPTSSSFGRVITSNVCGPTNAGGKINFKCSRNHVKIGETFGPNAKVPPAERIIPTKGTTNLPKPKKFNYHDDNTRKENVPKANEIHVISGLECDVNFITKNAIQNILMETGPKAPDRPTEIFKHKNYGKIPQYLIENKKLIKQEKQELAAEDENKNGRIKRNVTVFSEKDRLDLLEKLKSEWAKTNKEYQSMTHLVQLDTIGKVRRKERFESKLAQLEKDINTLSKKNVYIRED